MPEEVLSPDGLKHLSNGTMKVKPWALDNFHRFRERIGYRVYINMPSAGLTKRGYRSPEENKKIKGSARTSHHMAGEAFDMTPEEKITLEEYFVSMLADARDGLIQKAKLKSMHPEISIVEQGFRAIGIYQSKNFCHGDYRSNENDTIVVWNGDKQQKYVILKLKDFDKGLDKVYSFLCKELEIDDKNN